MVSQSLIINLFYASLSRKCGPCWVLSPQAVVLPQWPSQDAGPSVGSSGMLSDTLGRWHSMAVDCCCALWLCTECTVTPKKDRTNFSTLESLEYSSIGPWYILIILHLAYSLCDLFKYWSLLFSVASESLSVIGDAQNPRDGHRFESCSDESFKSIPCPAPNQNSNKYNKYMVDSGYIIVINKWSILANTIKIYL